MTLRSACLLFVASLLCLAACAPRATAHAVRLIAADDGAHSVSGARGAPRAATDDVPAGNVVVVEVVSTSEKRQHGLGDRRSLDEDRGMFFVYPDDRVRAFWMKDCYIALDIAYLRADGTVVKVATLPPGADAAPGQVPQESSIEPCRYVLEVPAGWFARRSLAAGTRVYFEDVVAGVVPE